MNTPSFQSLNGSPTRSSSPSDHRGGDNASKASRPPPPGLVDLRMEPTDDDSDLIVLGKQFEETITKIRGLYDPASPDDHLKLIEAMLVGLALQLPFCFEVSALRGSLVSPSPE